MRMALQTSFDHEQERRLLSSIQACKTRAILTPEQAIKIFKIKLSSQIAHKHRDLDPADIARAFGISEKAVRDIWKGRTWLRETMHLDPARAIMAARLRPPGRPRLNLQSTNRNAALNASDTVFQRTRIDPDRNVAEQISPLSTKPRSAVESAASVGQPRNTLTWWDTVPAEANDSHILPCAASSYSVIGRSGLDSQLWSAVEAAPLPESSRSDDPFHDDWRYWPKQEEGGAAR